MAASHAAPRHATRPALTPGSVGHGPTSKRPDAAHSRREPGRENRIFPAKSNRIATRTVAAAGLPRRTAARHAACARSPGCTPRPDVGGARPAHARASSRVGNAAGGAGRPGGVDRAAQNHFLGVDRAARTSHSRMRGKLSEVELSSWRKVTSLRRRERCERPRQRPELQPAGPALIA